MHIFAHFRIDTIFYSDNLKRSGNNFRQFNNKKDQNDMAKFINKANNYKTTNGGKLAWLWCLCFGPLYFAARRNWTMVFIGLFLGVFTLGISWLVFPFRVYAINRKELLMRGFTEVK